MIGIVLGSLLVQHGSSNVLQHLRQADNIYHIPYVNLDANVPPVHFLLISFTTWIML